MTTMKKTEQFIIFRNKKNGYYLEGYKSQGTLAFEADFTDAIKQAAITSVEAFEEQKKQFKSIAKAMDCEVILVEATFDLKYLNGGEVKEIERGEDAVNLKEAFQKLLSVFAQKEN